MADPYQMPMWNFQQYVDPRYMQALAQQRAMQQQQMQLQQQPSIAKQLANTAMGIGLKQGINYGLGQLGSATGLTSAATPTASTGFLGSLFGGGGAGASTGALGGVGSVALPLAAAALIAPPSISGVKNIFSGKELSGSQQAALALPTFGASFLYNPIKKLFGGGKHKDEVQRDKIKEQLRQSGFLGQGDTLSLGGQNFDTFSQKGAYNATDPNDPRLGETIARVQPLAAALLGEGEGKRKDDLTGYLANVALQGGNIQEMYRRAGLDQNSLNAKINELQAKGLGGDVANVYRGAAGQVFKNAPLQPIARANTAIPQPMPIRSQTPPMPSPVVANKINNIPRAVQALKPRQTYGGFFSGGEG